MIKPPYVSPAVSRSSSFHAVSTDSLFEKYGTQPSGLSSTEAEKRLQVLGPNCLPTSRHPGFLIIFFRQFLNPLIYVLVIVAVISVMIGHASDSIFILSILLVNAVIGAFQEHSAEKSALALRQVAQTRARVRRDGQDHEVSSESLVIGDIVLLESGNKVPADLRLISTSSLAVDESLLTGESIAVTKDPNAILSETTALGDRLNSTFAGTLITHGRALGVVTATGSNTELGRIAESVHARSTIKTPLLIRMELFSRGVAIGACLVIFLIGAFLIAQGSTIIEVFLFAVALAVSAIPEGLPIALTVALSIASRRMAKRNVIVRRLAAVEALGSCTYIGTDKTGTLTVNELTVRLVQFPGSEPWDVTGAGILESGRINYPKEINPSQAQLLISRLSEDSILCNEGTLRGQDGRLKFHGDAVDVALLALARKAGFSQTELHRQFRKIAEIPFESENRFAATLYTGSKEDRLSVKGAVEQVLPMCSQMMTLEGTFACQPSLIEEQAHFFARQGYRVLAIASQVLPSKSLKNLSRSYLKDLTFVGLVGMIDPLRPEAKEAVRLSQNAGIQVSMITGDHPVTALAIARELGLASEMSEVVTGAALRDAASDPARLEKLTASAKVYARVEPQQKLEIVDSVIRHGHFVAVTGDGANDAPALKAAHVGIAMGVSGTDVARETADLILADDRFSSIVGGIQEGRTAYANVRKVIYLLIATGAAEVLLFIMSIATGLPLPLTAIQLLWLNVVTNGIQDVALAFEPGEGDELKQKPRSPREPIFNRLMLERVTLSAAVIGGVTFLYYRHLIQSGISYPAAQNLTLLQMVLFENIMIGNARSETKSSLKLSPFRNPFLFYGTITAQGVHIATMYLPGLSDVLGMMPVTPLQWLTSLLLALSVLMVIEFHKWMKNKYSRMAKRKKEQFR